MYFKDKNVIIYSKFLMEVTLWKYLRDLEYLIHRF